MGMEIEVLKEAHMEKVQGMSVALARLQRTVMTLRDQLHQHGIQEGNKKIMHHVTQIIMLMYPNSSV